LSPRDSVMSMRQRCMDYIRMGVPEIWIFDPAAETAYTMRGEQIDERAHGILTVPESGIWLDIDAVFEAARKRTRR
ncbi:MAG: Uma2 family endonuclease, partial [Terriglobus sp.]